MEPLTRGQIRALTGLLYVVIATLLATFTEGDIRMVGFVMLSMSYAAFGILMPNITPKEKNSE